MAIFAGYGIFGFLVGIASLALLIWALIDCIGNTSLDQTMKIVWILVILFVGLVGPILYLAIGRKNSGGIA